MFRTVEQIRTTPGINLLKDSFKDKPCIIALTGPSLAKQLPLLKEQKCLIIAPDVSVSILERNGIQPHFTCAIERGECTTEETRGKHKAYLIVMPVVPQSTYDEYDGPKLIAYKKIDHFGYLPWERGVLTNPGIVGNMCFSLAIHLGCSPIVLVGADHAFVGRQTHSEGMREGTEMAYLQDTRMRVKVPGYYGGEVETAEPFLSAGRNIGAEAKGHVVWNCTEGGANIENCLNKPLSEVKFDEKYNCWWIIEKALKAFVPGDKEILEAHRLRGLQGIDRIIQACNEGLEELVTIKGVMLRDSSAFQILLMHVIQSFHVAFMMRPGDTKFWFMAVRDCARRIREELEPTAKA
jgi:hypothetical protein